jgi:hypothetical protein
MSQSIQDSILNTENENINKLKEYENYFPQMKEYFEKKLFMSNFQQQELIPEKSNSTLINSMVN